MGSPSTGDASKNGCILNNDILRSNQIHILLSSIAVFQTAFLM